MPGYKIDSPYDNVYWFARMLIDTDKYGGVGRNSSRMIELARAIRLVAKTSNGDINKLSKTVRRVLLGGKKEGSKVRFQIENLCDELEKRLITVQDYLVLALTCEYVITPVNNSLANIPSSDKEFVESAANALIASKGEKGLASIINLWDDMGSFGSIKAERSEAVQQYLSLKSYLDKELKGEEEKAIVLSAFCQEFERRVGQKRKGRAGGSLENVTSFILNYFGIKTTKRPEHFTTGLEIDRWVRCKDGWIIGISCKRTLRERWKQAYTTDIDMLNRHKIRNLWHVITYDRDLSDEKITEMGSHRVKFYLSEDSPTYVRASNHPGMKDYVRPITHFIKDLKELV